MPYQIIIHGGAYSHGGEADLRKGICNNIVKEAERDLRQGAAADRKSVV